MDISLAPLQHALEDPVTKSQSQCSLFKAALMKAYSKWEMTRTEKYELECVLGFKSATQPLLASNLKLRHAGIEILAPLITELRIASLDVPHRRFWHGSFLGPMINEREPHLDGVPKFQTDVYKLIHAAGLNAFGVTEFQPLTNYPQRKRGCSFLTNAHVIMWTDDPNFDANKAEKTMRATKRLKSALGAPTAELKPRDLSPGQLEYLAYYLLKVPVDGKYRRRDLANSSRWILKPASVRPPLLLRLAEILSHLELPDLVWGVGDGAEIRAQWKRELVAWNEIRCARNNQPLEMDFRCGNMWDGLRAKPGNGSRFLLPVII